MLRKVSTCKAEKPWTEATFSLHSADARKCHNTSSDAMDDSLGTRALREGEKEGKNEIWKLKTSSDINKCKKGFKDLLFPECYSE